MRRLGVGTCVLSILIMFFGVTGVLAQSETFCPPGQGPQFIYGFAFLKNQLGQVMGEPLECEHYDAAGNAFQKTTTGQALYYKSTNTLMFTAGNQQWIWTSNGVQYRVNDLGIPIATVTPLAVTPLTIRIMSYNVLFGAGVTPDWERFSAQQKPFSYPGNRLTEILAVIKSANPDILGIQEAAGWDRGTPSIAEVIANELGMNYFLAKVDNDLHVGLFTKFEIMEAVNLSPQIGNVGMLQATLATPKTQPLHVFMVHLDPFSAATRVSEIAKLNQVMSPYLQEPTILMGDMNFHCLNDPEKCQEYQALSRAGWRLVMKGEYQLDQIWTSPSLSASVAEITFPNASFDISDHLPVGAIIDLPPIP